MIDFHQGGDGCADHWRPRLYGHQWDGQFSNRSSFYSNSDRFKKRVVVVVDVVSVDFPGFDQLENLRPFSAAGVAVLAFNGGFAYDGWNQLNFITEEIKDPMKNLPRSVDHHVESTHCTSP